MPELSDQIRAYYDATTTSVDTVAVQHRVEFADLRQFDAESGNHLVEDIVLAPEQDEPRYRNRTWLMLAAAAIVLVAGFVIADNRADEEPVPADTPESTEPAAPDPEGAAPPVEPASLPTAFNPVPPARYRTNVLGVELTFDVPLEMEVLTARAGEVALARGLRGELSFPPSNDWSPDGVIELSFQRIGGWSTREEAIDSAADAGTIDPYDLDAWVADNDVALTRDDEIQIDRHEARLVDLEVDSDTTVRAAGCAGAYEPCFFAATIANNQDATRTRAAWVSGAISQRIYLITIEGSEPLAITVRAPSGSDWFDVVHTEIIDTLEIGLDAPPLGAN